MRVFSLFLAIAPALLVPEVLVSDGEAQQPGAKPEIKFVNDAWERLQQGGADATPGLRVSSHVRVFLRGNTQSNQITYRFIQRARSRLRQAAEQELNGETSITASGGLTSISSQGLRATLEVYVPAQVKSVSVEIVGHGDIEVHEFGGSLQARTPDGDIQAYNIGGTVQAHTGGGHIQLGSVGGRVDCLTSAGSIVVASAGEVNCQTAGGEILIKQARGPVSLSSGGGNITVEQASLNVDAYSTRGEIVVGQAGGLVTANTGGGAIRIGSSAGVRASSASGPIYLTGASGALSVSTALGSILAELLAGARLQNSSLVAASGDITVRIPSNVALSVLATNERGGVPHIDSDFSGVRTPAMNFSRPPLAEGSINGGGPLLMLSGSDMIYLRRTK